MSLGDRKGKVYYPYLNVAGLESGSEMNAKAGSGSEKKLFCIHNTVEHVRNGIKCKDR
jgi:hypothetical protein